MLNDGNNFSAIKNVTEKKTERKRRLILAFFVLFVLTLALGYVFRKPLLIGLAKVWIVNERVIKADAIVVLGGNAQGRAGAAAEMFKRGVADKILVMNVALNETDQRGLSVGQTALILSVLVSANIPTNAISVIGDGVTSTHEEALALRDWVNANHPKTVIVPTDLFHTRRVNWWFENILEKNKADVRVTAVEVRKYGVTNWWQQEEGLATFQSEVLKTGYYLLNY